MSRDCGHDRPADYCRACRSTVEFVYEWRRYEGYNRIAHYVYMKNREQEIREELAQAS